MTSQCVNFMLLALFIMLLGSLQQADSRQQHQQQTLKQHSSEKSQEHVKTLATLATTTTTTTAKRNITAAMHNKRHHHKQQQQQQEHQHSQSATKNQHHQQQHKQQQHEQHQQQHQQQQQHELHAKQQVNLKHNFKIKSSLEADGAAAAAAATGQQQQSSMHIHTHTRHAVAEQQQQQQQHNHHQHHQHHQHHHQHHHQRHQQQQQEEVSEHGHEHQPQELFNHDRHSRALHYDNNNNYQQHRQHQQQHHQHQQHHHNNDNNHNNNNDKRYHSNNNNNNNNNKNHNNNSYRHHIAIKTTTSTPAATEHALLRLTLNAANEHNTHLGHNHGQANVAVDNEDYYDNFDYDDVDDDDDDDDSTGIDDLQMAHTGAQHQQQQQQQKQHSLNAAAGASSTKYEAAFAARRVPRDHHYAASRPNSINFDGSNEEDYPADQPYGVITQKKLDELLTPERVENTFQQQYIRDQAKAHQRRMDSETRCSKPQPRVIHIRLGTSDTYYPSATILYRCNESTGCCLLPDHVCGPKHNETVQLPFEVKHGHRGAKRPILLSLVNHTECHCDMPTRFGDDLQRRKRSHGSLYTAAPIRLRTTLPRSQDQREAWKCICPKHFENFTPMDNADGENASSQDYQDYDYESSDNGLSTTPPTATPIAAMPCRCDCHESNRICQRMKRGEEGFAILDRFCISRNECSAPTCSHGVYIRHTGRCPHATSKASNSSSHHSHSQHAAGHRNYGFG